MAGVNRPLSRRFGPKLSYVEMISMTVSNVPATFEVPRTAAVMVNSWAVAQLTALTPRLQCTIAPSQQALVELTGITPVLVASFGSAVRLISPELTTDITLTIQAVLRGNLLSPVPVLSVAGTTGARLSAALVSPSVGVAHLVFGTTLHLASPVPILSGAGTAGGVAQTLLRLPYPKLTVNIFTEGLLRVALISPTPSLAPTGMAWLVSPSPTMQVTTRGALTLTYEAYAINLTTGVVTHYTNYPFDHILRFGSKFYGVATSGLFEIGGALDVTTPIDGHIKTFSTKLGSGKMKRVPYIYTSGRSDGGVLLGVTADEGDTYEYESDWGEVAGSTNHRSQPGKGIRGVYYSFDISNISGSSLELDSITAETAVSQRGI